MTDAIRELAYDTIRAAAPGLSDRSCEVIAETIARKITLAAHAQPVSKSEAEPDAGREALWKLVHEVWQLLDDGETDSTGVTKVEQDRLKAVSDAMDALEALVPDSEGPFWGGFPVNYLWPKASVPPTPETMRDRGARDMLNALLDLNPVVAKALHDLSAPGEPFTNTEGRIPFEVGFWVTSVAEQQGIKPKDEAQDGPGDDR